MNTTGPNTVAITQDELAFVVALGERIAQLRKDNQLERLDTVFAQQGALGLTPR